MNLVAIQRTLFRMQLDPVFCAEALSGEGPSDLRTGLGDREWSLIRAVDRRCFEADALGGRREQLLGNLSLEAPCTSAHWIAASGDGQGLHNFLGSREFHGALAEGGRLPLAFADWLEGQGAPGGVSDPVAGALAASLRLEVAMIRARRFEDLQPPRESVSGELGSTVGLSPLCTLVEVDEGCLDWVGRCTAAAAEGGTLPLPGFDPGGEVEVLLIQASEERSAGMGLRSVQVELLEGAAAELISASRGGLSVEARSELARELGAEPGALEGFVRSLIEDGVLRRT